ncbi:hypothetical protein [Halochromatium sp.]
MVFGRDSAAKAMSTAHIQSEPVLCSGDRIESRGRRSPVALARRHWLVLAGLLKLSLVSAQPTLDQHVETDGLLPQESVKVAASGSGQINERIETLAQETTQLRAQVAIQSDLLRGLMSGLDALAPVASRVENDASVSVGDALTACRGELADLNARLQQQQPALDEARRRAEKAEKAVAAMNEAQAHAETEIERLSKELAIARTRQAEALQQAVELERRLATAEARVARFNGNGQPSRAIGAEAELPSVRSIARPANETAIIPTDGQSAPSATAALASSAAPTSNRVAPSLNEVGTNQSREPAVMQAAAPVFYEVRAADTLSRISARV